jgi:lycopene beta-cyclase
MISVGIRGAGVAGLSFASALYRHVPEVSVSLFDIRERLPHPGRTFCFFRTAEAVSPVRPTHEWEFVAVSGQNFRRKIPCYNCPYTLITGNQLFEKLLHELNERGASCTWNCDSVTIAPRAITASGITQRFDLVVDAAFDPEVHTSTLWQSFGGLWVESERAVFDPQTALLMDLDGAQYSSAVSFVYLLPTSPTTALIEHTVFARQPLPLEQHISVCREWASRQNYTDLEILNTEYGRIPMGLHLSANSDSVLRIGTAGGAVRASTGYAFQTTLKQVDTLAQAIASALSTGASLPTYQPPCTPAWMRSSDDLFVRALANAPHRGQYIMSELLRRAPEQHLISFLAGTSTFPEALQVMTKAPKGAMISALLRSLRV